jgi:hypothetical protein
MHTEIMAPTRLGNVPPARVVREAGRPARPVPIPFGKRAQAVLAPMGEHARTAVGYAFGLWPLTCVIAFAAAMIIAAGHAGAP